MLHRLSLKLTQQVEEAADIVKRGGVVAFPTDTVYGLGANPYIDEAVDRIYKIKERPRHLPLPILVADKIQVNDVVASVSDLASLLMEHLWPGGLTLVLTRAASFPDNATAGGDSVAIRMPDHDVALALIRKAGVPIIGTSANLSNQPSVLTSEEVEVQLGKDVDLVIDSGRCPGGVESTVVDLTGQVPVILRQGAVSEKQINKIYREYLKKAGENAYCSRL